MVNCFRNQYVATFIATIGALMAGTFWSMSTWPKLDWSANITVCIVAGVLLGAFLPFLLLNVLKSRKYLVAVSAVPMVLFWLSASLTLLIDDDRMWYLCWIIGGIAHGSLLVSAPIYVAEISEHAYRGAIVTVFHLMFCAGCLYGYLAGPLFSPIVVIVLSGTIALLGGLLMLLMPDSPFLLLQLENDHMAEKVLKNLRNDTHIAEELEMLTIAVADNNDDRDPYLKELFRDKDYLLDVASIMILMMVQQTSCISIMYATAKNAMREYGVEMEQPSLMICLTAIEIVGTLLCMVLSESMGRKSALIVSTIGTIVCLVGISVKVWLDEGSMASIITVLFCSCHLLFYGLGLGPLPLLVSRETFLTTNCVCSATLAVLTYALSFGFVRLVSVYVDVVVMFTMCAVIMVLGSVMTSLVLVEAQGTVLDDLAFDIMEPEVSK